ncbi:MAG TPA: DUF5069 domain-containing protein [Clostridia bacterium]|nr:DUF5069 domain-containing protein [Clostridia bacterium]
MEQNLEKVKQWAKDLRKEEPRSPGEELAGFPLAARCLDKCRASLLGWQGDYMYGCPMDRQFLDNAGLDAKELREYVATGASDEDVARWIKQHAHVV